MWQPAHADQGAHQAEHRSLLRDVKIWGFLHTHKTAMVGNVLTPGGLLLRLTEFILPPPHPSLKEMYPRVDISYDQIRIRMNIQISGFEYCEKLSFHILLSTVAICANSNF